MPRRLDRVGIFLDRCERAVEVEEEGALPGWLAVSLKDRLTERL